ncbi:MAG TPA: hypothetical protein VF628_01860 [Allosphingosinicella sp.]
MDQEIEIMSIAQQASAYVSIYQVVEQLCAGQRVASGMAGAVFNAIDELRRMQAPREYVSLAERVSVLLHKLDWVMRSGDCAAQAGLRAELTALSTDWLDAPIRRH